MRGLLAGLALLGLARAHNITIRPAGLEYCRSQNQYLDTTTLLCESCGANQVPATAGDRCVCAPNAYRSSSSVRSGHVGAVDITCVACLADETVSLDGLSCVACAEPGCGCAAPGAVQSLRGLAGGLTTSGCVTCAASYYADPDPSPTGFGCKGCASSEMTGVECGCQSGFSKMGGSCIPNTAPTPSPTASRAVFSGAAIDSVPIQALLPSAHYHCKEWRNRTACQVLANMCVLQMYQLGAEDNACKLYNSLVTAGATGQHEIDSWPADLPWLYYTAGEKPQFGKDLQIKGSFDHSVERSGHLISKMQLVVAVYTLRGEFRGLQNLTDQFQLCDPVRPSVSDAWLWFGTTFELECTIKIRGAVVDAEVLESEPLFYDPYIVDWDEALLDYILYPAPVIVNDDPGQLYRRMFLFDNITGNGERLRYASSIQLSVRIREGEDGKVYPPTFNVDYTEVAVSGDQTGSARFGVTYKLGLDDYETSFAVACIVVGVLALIGGYIQTRSSLERNALVGYDLTTIAGLGYEFAALFSTGLYFVMSGTSLFILLFYKGASSPYILPPDDDADKLFEQMLVVGVSFKAMHVFYLVYQQCKVDIIFLDWENPKGGDDGGNKVSMWRTILVANEYNEIQTYRKVPCGLLLMLVLFFYYIPFFSSEAGRELALQNIDSDKHAYTGGENKILRFATAALLFNCVGTALWLYHKVIRVKLLGNPFEQFYDLCATANISILALTHRHRGYYLHGKSVFGHAEVDVAQMRENLNEEANANTGMRGLEPQSDEQLFEVYLPAAVRDKWDTLLLNRMAETGGGESTSDVSKAYSAINIYMKGFLSHSFSDEVNFRVREKSLLQRTMMMTPKVENEGVFYIDNSYYFCELLFLGNEGSLFIFEVFFFTVVDWHTQNWILATVLTYCIAAVVAMLRDHYGRANLAKKSLVNECFLI